MAKRRRDVVASIDRLRSEYGYVPEVSLDEALARTVPYFREAAR